MQISRKIVTFALLGSLVVFSCLSGTATDAVAGSATEPPPPKGVSTVYNSGPDSSTAEATEAESGSVEIITKLLLALLQVL